MTPSLENKHIKNTYSGVLHTGGEAIPELGKSPVYDGAGNKTPLSLGRYDNGLNIGELSYPISNNSAPIGALIVQTELNTLELKDLSFLYTKIIDFLYPVGSVYFSYNENNPADRFTNTEWEQVASGRFIVGVGQGNDGSVSRTFIADNNNGEYSHTLSVSELAAHRHNIITGQVSGADDNAGIPPWNLGSSVRNIVNANGAISPSLSADLTGQGAPHENTPPGFGLYVWKRTA